MFYEETYRIDSRDADPWYNCRPSAVLGLLQEAATQAACALHVSREEMMNKYNLFWMLARIWYRLDRPLKWDEQVTIRTWHRGGKGASSYRDFDLYVDGRPVGEAISLWVLADGDTHRLGRVSRVEEFRGTDGGELCKDRQLGKLNLPDGMQRVDSRTFHYSDTDVNGHVNNGRYADLICDGLRMERLGEEQFVSSLQVGYLAECRPGETVELYTGASDSVWYVHGADSSGKSRFDGAVSLAAYQP